MSNRKLLLLNLLFVSIIQSGNAKEKKLSSLENLWQNKKPKNYEYIIKVANPTYGPLTTGPFCVKVKNGQLFSVKFDSTAFVPDTTIVPEEWWAEYSIEYLLGLINSAKEMKVKKINFEMDSIYGYPKYMYIDYDSSKVDDEVLFKVYKFKVMNK